MTMPDEDGLHTTSERFYAAVHAVVRGDPAPMLAVWSHGEEASYCTPGSDIVLGWPALEAYWRQAAAANAVALVHITGSGQVLHAVVQGDLACVVTREEVRREGESSVMEASATLVYRREGGGDGGWRLLHRHADAAPKVSDQEGQP
jgi:ketosteroid isomerase-like protein